MYLSAAQYGLDVLTRELKRLNNCVSFSRYEKDRLYIRFKWPNKEYTYSITLEQLYGQCGVLLASGLPKYDRQGVIDVVEAVAAIFGYRSVMVTDTRSSPYLEAWLDAGYQVVWTNYNYHSGNTIQVAMKDIGQHKINKYRSIANLFD